MIKMIVDTHAHLNTEEFNLDIANVIERAKENDVLKVIVIGMDLQHNLRAIELAKTYDMLYATVGVHPSYVDTTSTDHLEALLVNKRVVAIGECGIDLYWSKDNLELQKKVFIEQIKLAEKYKLPLVIHTRSSFEEAYQCLLPYKGKVTGVFHCFSSNLFDAKRAIELGFYLGVDGPITYKNAKDIKEIVATIDLKHILVETDSPYLSPAPNRSSRNEPANLSQVIKTISEIKKISMDEVKQQTTHNAYHLFNLGGTNP
jgi:TatD DNase family protein